MCVFVCGWVGGCVGVGVVVGVGAKETGDLDSCVDLVIEMHHTYMCLNIHVYTCIHVYIDVCLCVHRCVFVCLCLCLCLCVKAGQRPPEPRVSCHWDSFYSCICICV